MNTDQMVTQLSSMLGNIGIVLNDTAVIELQMAQVQAERGPVLPHFLIKEKTATVLIDTPRVSTPSDFIREAEESALTIVNDGDFIPLQKNDLAELRDIYENDAGGLPHYYALLGNYFWIYPKPDESYPIRMNYYARDTVLAAGDSGNLWSARYPDLLIGLAGLNISLHQQNAFGQARFQEMVRTAREQMTLNETAREVANMERSFGE